MQHKLLQQGVQQSAGERVGWVCGWGAAAAAAAEPKTDLLVDMRRAYVCVQVCVEAGVAAVHYYCCSVSAPHLRLRVVRCRCLKATNKGAVAQLCLCIRADDLSSRGGGSQEAGRHAADKYACAQREADKYACTQGLWRLGGHVRLYPWSTRFWHMLVHSE